MAQPEMRPEHKSRLPQFPIQPVNPIFQLRPLDLYPQVTQAHLQQLLIGE